MTPARPAGMPDIVERLRDREIRWANSACFDGGTLFGDAADEIEQLRTRIIGLEALLVDAQKEVETLRQPANVPDSIANLCDLALSDALTEIEDEYGGRVHVYDDAKFAASLAGNGYRIVPVSRPASAGTEEVVRTACNSFEDAPGCLYPNCDCKKLPKAIIAALASLPARSGEK